MTETSTALPLASIASTATSPAISRWRFNAPAAPLPILPSPGQIIRTRSFLIAALSYLAVFLLLFWPLFRGDSLSSGAQTFLVPPFAKPESIDAVPYVNPWTGDFVEQFAWFEEYQYRAALEGRFPTWNPHIYMGQPFHADGQSAMLFPTHWIYFLVDPNIARGPMTILRLWFCAIALFTLLRRFSLAPTAAFVGGAVYTLASFNMHWLLWPQTNATLWVPMVILAMDYLVTKPSSRRFASASLLTAPLFLSGHPGTIYLCGILAGIYVLLRLIGLVFHGLTLKQILISTASAVGAVFTGLLMAAAAMLPLYMQIRQSFEFLDPAGHRGSTDPTDWITCWLFLMPEYFGRPRGGYPGFVFTGPANYIEQTMWFGAIALLLVLAASVTMFIPSWEPQSQKWKVRFSFLPVFGLTTLLLALSIIYLKPVLTLVSSFPGMSLTSLNRFSLAMQFAAAVLAAWAVQQILIRKDRIIGVLTGVFAIIACWLITHSLWMRWPEIRLNWMACVNALPGTYGQRCLELLYGMISQYAGFRMMVGALILFTGTFFLICILVPVIRRREISPTLRYLFAAIITLDVILPAYDFNPVTPQKLVAPPTPEVLQSMILQASDGRMLALDMLLDPNLSMHYGFRDIRGYDLPHSLRLCQVYKRLDMEKMDHRGLLDLSRLYPYINPSIKAWLDRTCVRSLMVYHPDPNAAHVLTSLKLTKEFESPGYMNWPQTAAPGGGIMVFSNPNSYPRAFFAKVAAPVTKSDDAMDALLDINGDLRDHSVYEGNQPPPPPAPMADSPDETASLTLDKPEHVTIAANSTAEHLLVLEDRMDQGWQVEIDGKPAEALTANYLFRGVIVPAGHHTVDWTYHAPGLITGVILSIVSTLSMLAVLIMTSWPRKKLPSESSLASSLVPAA